MTGRADVLSALDSSPQITLGEADTATEGLALYHHQQHMRRADELRSWMCKREAEIAIRVCNTRNLRSGMKLTVEVGQAVEIYAPSLRRWIFGYRAVGKCDSHIIVEKGKC